MVKQSLSPEALQIHDARKAAVAELKAIDSVEREITDPAVIRLSNARLYEQAITLRVLKGERIPASEIKASDDLILAARNAVPKPMHVDVHIVGPADEATCPKCQHVFKPPEIRQTFEEARRENAAKIAAENAAKPVLPAAAPKAPGTVDLVVGAGKASTGRPLTNVTPIITAADRRKQALDAAPLKKHQFEPWDAYRAQIPAV